MVMVVGVVDKRRVTKTTIDTKTTTPTIPPPIIQIDKFFLIITATLTTDIFTTPFQSLPSLPYYHRNLHFNSINTTTTQTTLSIALLQYLIIHPYKNHYHNYHIQYCAIPYHGNHHQPYNCVNTKPYNLETTKPQHKSLYKLLRVVVKAVVRPVNLIVVLVLH